MSHSNLFHRPQQIERDAEMLNHRASVHRVGYPSRNLGHTVLVILPLAAMSVAGWYQHGLPNAHVLGLGPRLSSFVTVVLVEWFQVLLIWLALRRRGLSIGSTVSGRWQTSSAFFKDLGLAVGFVVIVADTPRKFFYEAPVA
jgi:hypothetical protein